MTRSAGHPLRLRLSPRALAFAVASAVAGACLALPSAPVSATSAGPPPARPVVAVVDTGVIPAELPGSVRNQWHCAKVCRAGSDEAARHGTEVARTIVNSAPQALIDSYDVTDEFGAISPPTVTAAIRHATARGIPVINVSLVISGDQPALQRVLRRASRSVVVAAAGNDGYRLTTNEPLQPCMSSAKRVVCVTGSTPEGTLAGYNHGRRWVDLAAPSVVPASVADPGGRAFTGTSAATALVSGALARMLSDYPCLRPEQARRLMLGSVAHSPGLRSAVSSGGTLNIPAALRAGARACG